MPTDLVDDPRAFCRPPDAELLRRGPGRSTWRWRGVDGTTVVAKLVARGLLARPGRREAAALAALRAAGLRVPAVLALHALPEGDLLLLEDVPHASDLRRRLRERPAEAARWAPAVLALVVALHARGWFHKDLYLDHLVVELDAQGREVGLCLLDLGRARRRRRPRRRWLVKDLAALEHSTPAAVGARTRLAFLARYLRARGLRGRDELERWRAAVRAKARRMAAHVPRGGVSVHGGVEVVS